MCELADEAAAEQQHAGHENHALDHGDPLPKAGKILLHGDDHEGACHGSEHGAEAADQRHQHDLARHAPMHVGERGVLRDEHFQRAGKARKRAREDEGEKFVLIGLVAERDRALFPPVAVSCVFLKTSGLEESPRNSYRNGANPS